MTAKDKREMILTVGMTKKSDLVRAYRKGTDVERMIEITKCALFYDYATAAKQYGISVERVRQILHALVAKCEKIGREQ